MLITELSVYTVHIHVIMELSNVIFNKLKNNKS